MQLTDMKHAEVTAKAMQKIRDQMLARGITPETVHKVEFGFGFQLAKAANQCANIHELGMVATSSSELPSPGSQINESEAGSGGAADPGPSRAEASSASERKRKIRHRGRGSKDKESQDKVLAPATSQESAASRPSPQPGDSQGTEAISWRSADPLPAGIQHDDLEAIPGRWADPPPSTGTGAISGLQADPPPSPGMREAVSQILAGPTPRSLEEVRLERQEHRSRTKATRASALSRLAARVSAAESAVRAAATSLDRPSAPPESNAEPLAILRAATIPARPRSKSAEQLPSSVSQGRARARVHFEDEDQSEEEPATSRISQERDGVSRDGPVREPHAYTPWATNLKWRYLEPTEGPLTIGLPPRVLTALHPVPWLPTITESNPRVHSGHQTASAWVMEQGSGGVVPRVVYDGAHDRLLVFPHETPYADLRGSPSHQDYLPPRKLCEYQALEATGFAVWRHDRNTIRCALPGCYKVLVDHDVTTQLCLGCGPQAGIRYCSKAHLLADMVEHWKECAVSLITSSSLH